MSGLGAVSFCQIANRVSPIGEKRDCLVHLQALSLQHFKEASPRLRVVARHQSKSGCGSVSRYAFPDNYFKRSILTALFCTCMNIPAIQTDDEWRSWFRQVVPRSRTARDKRGLLVSQFAFETPCHLMDMS